jgi:hypothetical protein
MNGDTPEADALRRALGDVPAKLRLINPARRDESKVGLLEQVFGKQ